jgi:tetratricopeptide (TPR) repeat protein
MQRGTPVYFRTWFLLAQFLPVGAYLVAFSVARRYRRLQGDPGYARFARAAREARKAIAAVRRSEVAGDAPSVYDGLARAVREYLSAKLALPVGAVDVERVAARLGASAPEVVEQVREFLSLVERMHYAPGADGGHDRQVLELAEKIVRGLERQGGLAGRFDSGRRAAVLGLALAGVTVLGGVTVMADADRDPMTTFFESNAQYKAGNYAEAATGYAQLVDAGFRSAPLYYNLGNALFKDGAVGGAVLNYERARRLSPRDPDVRANLQFARERIGAGDDAMPLESPLWLRLLVPLAFRAGTTGLVVTTSVIYTLLMGVLGIQLFVPRARQLCGRAAIVTGVVLALVASAAGLQLVEEHVRTTAVVTRAGTASVRFEPSASGTVHFTLPEGAVVRELARRDGWRQVARGDGRRGWVEATAVEAL